MLETLGSLDGYYCKVAVCYCICTIIEIFQKLHTYDMYYKNNIERLGPK